MGARASDCRWQSTDRLAQAFRQKETEELAHGRKLPRAGGGGEPLAAELCKVGAHAVGRSVEHSLSLGGKESKELA